MSHCVFHSFPFFSILFHLTASPVLSPRIAAVEFPLRILSPQRSMKGHTPSEGPRTFFMFFPFHFIKEIQELFDH